MTNDRETVDDFLQRFAAAWQANDGPAAAGFFTDDGTLINPFGERADGRPAVSAMYAGYFDGMLKGTSTSVTVGAVRVVEADHALVDAEQTIHGPGGDVLLAVHLATLLRRAGDSWLFVDARPYTTAPTGP